ncbi:MAG: glycosyltransferase [bacterium]|nr:glycosyltransferase [bacterium]
MKTILFVLESLKGGGAERTVLNIANHLDRRMWRPVFVLYRKVGIYLQFVRDDVEIVELECNRPRDAPFAIARVIKRIRPDLIFSTLLSNNIATSIGALCAGTRSPVVVRESNNQTASGRGIWSLHSILARWAYHRACRVVALSEGVRHDVIARYHLPPDQVVTIYNPIDIGHIERAGKEIGQNPDIGQKNRIFEIIAVGKLHPQKGFDLLIRACARLKTIPWRLTILGEGRQRKELEKIVQTLKIENQVRLPGFCDNPYSRMSQADMFVLSSRWEGFGHVIAEAMVCGVPVLATRCPSGPDEILHDGLDGRLCEPNSVDSLADGLFEFARNPDVRMKYAVAAKDSVKRFSVDRITREYEALFNVCLNQK